MRATTLINKIQSNSLDHELKLRDIERRLSAANAEELRIEKEIASRLTVIASLHVDSQIVCEQEAQHQLKLRHDEENSMREQLAVVEGGIAAMLQEHNAAKDVFRKTERAIAESLALNPAYLELSDQQTNEGAAYRMALLGEREIIDECQRKLPAFQHNDLYRYLVAASYGTDKYHRTGVIRYLDGWIATLCNFHENRRNELTLTAMRETLDKASQERKARIDQISDKLKALVKTAEDAAGLHRLVEQVSELEKKVEREKKRANDIHARLKEYADKTDFRYRKAKELVAGWLKNLKADELLAQVKSTPDLRDDAIAKEVIDLHASLNEHRRLHQHLYSSREQADKSYNRAKSLERTLREKRYSSTNYEYDNGLDVGSLITGYMAGRMSVESAVGEVKKYQREVEEESAYYRSRSSSSSSGGFSFGGSSSDSSFSTSSSSGGDSFSTSDSF